MSNALQRYVNHIPRLIWTGATCTTYEFEHHPIDTTFNTVGGVYIFCKEGADRRWYAVYIGQTDNFRGRLTDELATHHRLESISHAGATHICALVVTGDESKRLAIETDLRHALNPPCNRQ